MSQPSQHPCDSCLAILVGLPGAGKSTFAEALQSALENDASCQNVTSRLVAFDSFTPPGEKEEAGLDKEIVEDGHCFIPSVWKAGRREALLAMESLLVNHRSNESRLLVIVDDTMHLRSMRRQAFQVARKYGAAFVMLYVDASLQEARARNQVRPSSTRIPDHVWTRVANTLEPPNPVKYGWEALLLRVSSCKPPAFVAAQAESVLRELLELWGNATCKPLATMALAAQREAGCDANNASLIHALDKRSRKVVATTLSAYQNGHGTDAWLGGMTRENIATYLTRARKDMLLNVKSAARNLPVMSARSTNCNDIEDEAMNHVIAVAENAFVTLCHSLKRQLEQHIPVQLLHAKS